MISKKIKEKRGFTLIELIIVIVILGIIAAIAIPKFAGLSSSAKKGVLKGVEGSLKSAMNIVHSKWLIEGGSSVKLSDDTTVKVNDKGYPTASSDGILKAIDLSNSGDLDNVTGSNKVYIGYDASKKDNCECCVIYSAGNNDIPTITLKDSCE